MKRINPLAFYDIGYSAGAAEIVLRVLKKRSAGSPFSNFERLETKEVLLPENERVPLYERAKALREELQRLELHTSAITAQRIVETYSQPKLTGEKYSSLIEELAGRIRDETHSRLFYQVDLDKHRFVTEAHPFGTEVTSRFPDVVFDIEEAGKSYAFGRNTACVFHLMRVMEVGLRALGNALKDPALTASTNRSWETILKKCDTELSKPIKERSPAWSANDKFFSDCVARLRAVKDAWRNPTMHIENKYTEEEAVDIWNHVGSFMRRLAARLNQDGELTG